MKHVAAKHCEGAIANLPVYVALHPKTTLHLHSKVIYLRVNFGFQPRFPENLQYLIRCGWILGSGNVSMNIYSIWGRSIWGGLRWAPPRSLWVQHLRWAPVWASPGFQDKPCRDTVGWRLLNSRFFACSFGMAPSELKMFHLRFWDATLTQDVWPAVWRWRLLNARCFACSFGMAPPRLPFEYCNINFSCHSNIALRSTMI